MTNKLEFTEDELKDLYLALIAGKINNQNAKAVNDFTKLQDKIKKHLSAETIQILEILECIM